MNLFRKNINKELADKVAVLEESLVSLESENETLKNENISLSQELADLKGSLEINKINEEKHEEELTEVLEVIQEHVEAVEAVETVAAVKAVEILASVGQPAIEIIEDENEAAIEEGRVTVAEQIKSLSGAELNEFFKANKHEIFKLLKK